MTIPPKFNWSWSFDEDASPSHTQNESSSNASTDGSSINNIDEHLPATPGSSFEEDLAAFLESPTTWPDAAPTDATEPHDFPDFALEPANSHLPFQLIEMSRSAFRHCKDIPIGFVRPMTINIEELCDGVLGYSFFHGIRHYIESLAGYKIGAYYGTNVAQAVAAIPADDNAGLRDLVESLQTERDDARDHLTIAVNVISQVANHTDDEWHREQAVKAIAEKKLEDSKNQHEKELEDIQIQHEKELANLETQHEKQLEAIKIQHDKDLLDSQIAHLRAELELNEAKLDIQDLERACDRHLENNTVLFEKLQDSHMAFEYHDNLTSGYRDIVARQVENLKGQLRYANARIEEVEEAMGRVEEEVEREVDEEWVQMIQRMDVGAECVGRVNRRRRMVGEEEGMMRG